MTSCGLLGVNVSWNVLYLTKISSPIGRHDNQVSPRLCCGPQIGWPCQHQRDVYNGKSHVTSSNLQGLHARQLQFAVVNEHNGFPMRSIGLVIRSLKTWIRYFEEILWTSVIIVSYYSIFYRKIQFKPQPLASYYIKWKPHRALTLPPIRDPAVHLPLWEWVICQIWK